jgi:hypothetical protein
MRLRWAGRVVEGAKKDVDARDNLGHDGEGCQFDLNRTRCGREKRWPRETRLNV